ncbi:HAD-IB family hydrolase [Flavobacterium sp. DG1-102-2]|uniref:HAD family hydrolase n=1 Tax=Flavobacterium sp. DG1-102-2 TaxID=3081663 RepID=UPI002948D294|nr:HAD-IB family hydrolase [Flavobacterium sp. DG1-102-2]MDV6168116.1 HAD-IB family hydrolase [Flavobacterium sp. DG1-102-2]
MTKTLAIFDFDNTLYSKDSLLEFTRFAVGRKSFYIGIAKLFPHLAALKLGLQGNAVTKQKYLSHFFGGMDRETFKQAASNFSLNKIDKNLNPQLSQILQTHIDNNDTIYIVSASFTEWLEPWCKKNNFGLICSKLQIENEKVTGKIDGLNCYGPEKTARINDTIDLSVYDSVYVYGKGKGDREMLLLRR